MADIFSAGFSPELDRSESMLQPALDSYSDVTPSGVSGSISPVNLSSGTLASILFSGKETFTSTTAGYRMGIDLSDDIYKWVIGGSTSSIDWAVTTADTLTVVGTITATAGTIGGFSIGSDYIRDAANSFGLASTVTGGDDVRFWAGDTFANRAIAPLRLYESGAVVGTALTAQNIISLTSGTAGETLTAGDSVYLKASDSKLWKTDGDTDEPTYSFVGIINTGGGADATVTFSGLGTRAVTGLTLTAGSYYYISGTAGALSTTPHATRYARVGFALSSTVLMVLAPVFFRTGGFTFSATGDTTITTGFYPARVILKAIEGSATSTSTGDERNICTHTKKNTSGIPFWGRSGSYAVLLRTSTDAANTTGTISSRTATTFVFNCDYEATGTQTHTVDWEASS